MSEIKNKERGALAVQTRAKVQYGFTPSVLERGLYRSLRESVPIIDAAINKTKRLLGDFEIKCGDKSTEREINNFLKDIQVGTSSRGIDQFLGTYLEELITYGSAVGEIALRGKELGALYNASLNDVEVKENNDLTLGFSCVENGERVDCKYPQLIMFSALNPEPGAVYGTSVLRGLPFVCEILMNIYSTVGVNWERLGNVRFAVSCKQDGSAFSQERIKQVATEWQKAMRSSDVRDFVSVGDVSIKAIGSDVQILDSQIPVRQMLEQIVAKMGIPPFLLGLSWSSTERMSSQQADILTSELEFYRRLLNPVISRIVNVWLMLRGKGCDYEIEWNDITMQDEVDHANALYTHAKTRLLEIEINEKEGKV